MRTRDKMKTLVQLGALVAAGAVLMPLHIAVGVVRIGVDALESYLTEWNKQP